MKLSIMALGTRGDVEPLLLELLERKEYKLNAERIAAQIREEEFTNELIELIA